MTTTPNTRYAPLFAKLAARGEGAFIPFAVLGDPTPADSLAIIEAMIRGGADALELGIPFSDPIADGPTIQASAQRALSAGTTPDTCWTLLARIRGRHPDLPIGLLVYANLVAHHGFEPGLERFYRRAAAAGVDSILVADVPSLEAPPFAAAARAAGVDPVLLAPPDATPERLAEIATLGSGYIYVLTRAGITGARDDLALDHASLMQTLRDAGAPPARLRVRHLPPGSRPRRPVHRRRRRHLRLRRYRPGHGPPRRHPRGLRRCGTLHAGDEVRHPAIHPRSSLKTTVIVAAPQERRPPRSRGDESVAPRRPRCAHFFLHEP